MNTFQWLLILGFPADVAASCTVPQVFAPADAVTANDLAVVPERRDSPKLAVLFLEVGGHVPVPAFDIAA